MGSGGAIGSFFAPIIQAAGSLEQGQATANAANYNAEVARLNAAYTSQAGMTAAEDTSFRAAAGLARMRAGIGANNIDVNSGSALKAQQTERGFGTLSAENVENNALLKAYGYKAEAELDTQEGRQAIIGSYFGAAGDLLSGSSGLEGGANWASDQTGGGAGASDTGASVPGVGAATSDASAAAAAG